MSKLVTIYGGSGFVGRYIARRMAKDGWRVRVATRNPNEAMFVKPYGAVGQVEPVFCNVRDDASVRSAMQGAEAVVNCTGTFATRGRNNMQAVQVEGAARIARLAAEEGVARMIHVSAIGAAENGPSEYLQSKAAGEAAVLAAMPRAVILRPSILFGNEDAFFNRFGALAAISPVLPLVGAETRFQPLSVEDLAEAAAKAVRGDVAGGVYELGGPDVMTFRELMQLMLGVIRRRRLIVNLPFWIARFVAPIATTVDALSLGIIKAPITPDQVRSLTVDNVVADSAKGLRQMRITPVSMAAVLPDYLWRFRPSGQYAAIKESAKNLRKA